MSDVFATVVTPQSNKDAAVALGGGESYDFSAFATDVAPDEITGDWPNGPGNLWVLGSGAINPTYLAAYQAAAAADPTLYYVDQTPPWSHALQTHPQGPLYRYYPPQA